MIEVNLFDMDVFKNDWLDMDEPRYYLFQMRSELTRCSKKKDAMRPTTWYKRTSGVRRRYKHISCKAVEKRDVVNQITRKEFSGGVFGLLSLDTHCGDVYESLWWSTHKYRRKKEKKIEST